jgi:hypothetical protein
VQAGIGRFGQNQPFLEGSGFFPAPHARQRENRLADVARSHMDGGIGQAKGRIGDE